MEFWWLLGGAVILAAVLLIRNQNRRPWGREGTREKLGPRQDIDRVEGDQAELWPDRTGPQTKKELGARKSAYEGNLSPGASPPEEQSRAEYLTWQYVSPAAKPDLQHGKDKESGTVDRPGNEAARIGAGQPHERGPRTVPTADHVGAGGKRSTWHAHP